MADSDAIKILKLFKSKLHGGVCHCFGSGPEIAKVYTEELGLCIGVGGTILMHPEISSPLVESVKEVSISSILLETDGPYVKPLRPEEISRKKWMKARNTSLILPAVAKKIADIKEMYQEEVERVTFENTVRVFRLEDKIVNSSYE